MSERLGAPDDIASASTRYYRCGPDARHRLQVEVREQVMDVPGCGSWRGHGDVGWLLLSRRFRLAEVALAATPNGLFQRLSWLPQEGQCDVDGGGRRVLGACSVSCVACSHRRPAIKRTRIWISYGDLIWPIIATTALRQLATPSYPSFPMSWTKEAGIALAVAIMNGIRAP